MGFDQLRVLGCTVKLLTVKDVSPLKTVLMCNTMFATQSYRQGQVWITLAGSLTQINCSAKVEGKYNGNILVLRI